MGAASKWSGARRRPRAGVKLLTGVTIVSAVVASTASSFTFMGIPVDDLAYCGDCHVTMRTGTWFIEPHRFVMPVNDLCQVCCHAINKLGNSHKTGLDPFKSLGLPENWQELPLNEFTNEYDETELLTSCGSCHNPHLEPTIVIDTASGEILQTKFLRKRSEANPREVKLCTTCHTKRALQTSIATTDLEMSTTDPE